MFRATAIVSLVIPAVLWSSPALACGGMVSGSTNAELTATDALLSFDGARERLLVQVGFGGSGGEGFGWLLPLPSSPEIDEASNEPLVAALESTRPPPRDDSVPSVFPEVCACGGGDDETAAGGVQHLGTEVVGGLRFDTIAGSPGAVDVYLERHDFNLDPHQRSAIREYMTRDWVIVTATVAPGAPPGGSLTPILFTFDTDEAIYPLAMAGDDHAGIMEMELFTLTPFRPSSQTFDERIVRPASDGILPEAGDRLELVYSAPLPPAGSGAFGSLDPPEGAWLSRYRAAWNIESLKSDLVLAAGPSTPVTFRPLLDDYESDARWVGLGQMALFSGFLGFLTLVIGIPLLGVVWLFRAVRRR